MKRMIKSTLLAAPLALAILFTAPTGLSAADSAKSILNSSVDVQEDASAYSVRVGVPETTDVNVRLAGSTLILDSGASESGIRYEQRISLPKAQADAALGIKRNAGQLVISIPKGEPSPAAGGVALPSRIPIDAGFDALRDQVLSQAANMLQQMNQEKLGEILELNQKYVGPKTILGADLSEINAIIKEAFNPWTWILKIQIIMILIIGLSKLKDKIFTEYFKFAVLQALMLYIFIVVLSTGYQIPERISLNLLAALTLSLFAHTNMRQKIRSENNLILNISSGFFILVFIYLASTRISIETSAREGLYLTRQAYANQQIDSLSKLDKQAVISNGSGLKTHWRYPYTKWKSFDPRDKAIILGWHNLSPLSIEQFKIRDLNLSSFPKYLINSDVFWVDSRDEIGISRDYFQQFAEKSLGYSEEGKIGNDEYQFYRFFTIE
jgi:hypothetical protein